MRKISKQPVYVSVWDGGPYKRKDPRVVRFGKHTIPASDWTEMTQKVCDAIAADNPKRFRLVLKYVRGKNTSYFEQFNLMGDASRRPYRIKGTDIGVRCNLQSNNHVSLCEALSIFFGYGRFEVECR